MTNLEEVKKARIKDGALVVIGMSYCRWEDNGEVFIVYDFIEGRKCLVADGYGSKAHYGNGAVYVSDEDLIYTNQLFEPKPGISKAQDIKTASVKDAECQQRVERILDQMGTTIIGGDLYRYLREEDWQALKKQEVNND